MMLIKCLSQENLQPKRRHSGAPFPAMRYDRCVNSNADNSFTYSLENITVHVEVLVHLVVCLECYIFKM